MLLMIPRQRFSVGSMIWTMVPYPPENFPPPKTFPPLGFRAGSTFTSVPCAIHTHDLPRYHPRLPVYHIRNILTIYSVPSHAYPMYYIYGRFTLLPLTLTRMSYTICTCTHELLCYHAHLPVYDGISYTICIHNYH